MHEHGRIPIWFFIGVLLTAYGVLILGAGIYGLWHPAHGGVGRTAHRHLVGRICCLLIGLVYVWRFYPRK